MISIASLFKNIAGTMVDFKVYLDMDGCLTNFDLAVKKLGPDSEKGLKCNDSSMADAKFMWEKIKDSRTSFWSGMEWMPKGEELWDIVKVYNPVLLSSPGDNVYAKAGKESWVNEHIPGITLIVEREKYIYAERDAVLIDDSKSNIDKWINAGGIGILYENNPSFVKDELIKVKAKI